MPKQITTAELERESRKLMDAARGEQCAGAEAKLSDEEFEHAYREQVKLAESKLRDIRTVRAL